MTQLLKYTPIVSHLNVNVSEVIRSLMYWRIIVAEKIGAALAIYYSKYIHIHPKRSLHAGNHYMYISIRYLIVQNIMVNYYCFAVS